MDSGGNDAILVKALKDLMMHWERSQATWHDQARLDFERDCVAPLGPALTMAANAVQKIEEVLRRAQKDCS